MLTIADVIQLRNFIRRQNGIAINRKELIIVIITSMPQSWSVIAVSTMCLEKNWQENINKTNLTAIDSQIFVRFTQCYPFLFSVYSYELETDSSAVQCVYTALYTVCTAISGILLYVLLHVSLKPVKRVELSKYFDTVFRHHLRCLMHFATAFD